MPLERIYRDWAAVRAATGTPSSAQRRAWREYLRTRPALVYWGDSWFETPLYKNLGWHSFARIEGMCIRLGAPGELAADLLEPKKVRNLVDRIESREFDALCLSIGGNDALAARLLKVFRDSARMEPEEAFEKVVAAGIFARLCERYDHLMQRLATHAPHVPVVGHGYAKLRRIGVRGKVDLWNLGLAAPLIRNVGPWLWPPMKPVLGTHDAARRFAELLLVRGFRDLVLKPIAKAHPKFTHADFSLVDDCDAEDFWYDEIHPTEAGFGVLAAKYNETLREALPAAKRGAVG